MQKELPPPLAVVSLAALATLAGPATAQVRHPGEPAGPRMAFADHVPTLDVPAPDVQGLLEEDLAREEAGHVGPLRYGVLVPAPIDFTQAAAWDLSADGTRRVGRLRVHSEGAFSLGLEFERYDLPEEGRVFLYDEREDRTVFGAYTHEERIPTGEFVVEPFPGDSVVLEYVQPAELADMPRIVLRGVIYDYLDFPSMERGWNETQAGEGDGGCTVNVNCPEGDPYELQKRATVRTLYQGGLCSGGLINNTADDGTQYLYTANHCGTGSTVNVRFNYQTENCNGGTTSSQSVSGATVLATDVDTDGRLLRVTNAIPPSYGPFFSGWSRSTTNLSFGMSMHHPGGGPKNISIDNNGGSKGTSFFIGIGSVKVWFMNFHVGGTAGGSSGGPLFDEGLFIRGTLTGGPQGDCSNSQYGRFQNFWNDTNISNFLDPLGTGVLSHGGFDPNDVVPVVTDVSPDAVQVFGSGTVTVTGTGFSGVDAVHLGSTTLTSGQFFIQSPTEISFTPPAPATLGTVDVSVENGVAESNSMTLEFLETSPPKIASPTVSSGGLPLTWTYGGGPGDVYVLVGNVGDPTTIPFEGFDLLVTFVVLDIGALDGGNGIGSLTVTTPMGLSFENIYAQVITVDGGGAIDGSAVTATLVL